MTTILCLLALAAIAMANPELEKILHESNDQFTTRMFSEVVKSKPEESVVISAFSVLSPLAQLGLAAVGETHDETLRTIGFSNDTVAMQVFADVNKRLRSIKDDVELKLANRIYVKTGAELNDQFASISRDVFASDVKNVDFVKAAETAGEINAWVEDNTNHRIKDLVNPDSLGPNTAALLVNAIYFKGKWKSQFNKAATRDDDFYVTKDKTVKVPMMFQSQDFSYGESKELDAKLLELPYEGDQSSLLIVLPNQVDGINSLIEKLRTPSALNDAVENMFSHEVEVTIPRFKIETTTDLKAILIKMGCTRLFTAGQAMLDNLLKGQNDLYISDGLQKAYIEVNEEGAEAAAANVFGISYLSAVISEKYVFKANHPFVFILKEENTTLFNGVFRS